MASPVANAPGSPASFTGTFASDADQREFFFTLTAAGPVAIRTWSYAGGTNAAGTPIPAGGFDPTLTLYDSTGAVLLLNQDGGCGSVAADPVTASCWDAYIATTLPAGAYRIVLTQSSNLPAGSSIADSFIYNPNNLFNNADLVNGVALPPFGGMNNFTQPPGMAGGNFWDFFPSQRTGAYAVDIVGAASVVAPAVSTGATLPFGITGSAYASLTLMASGSGGAYTWTPPLSGLPPGMSVSASGVLSGTPTAAGTYMFTALGTDGVQPVQQTETIVIYNPLAVTTASLPGGTSGSLYGPVQLTVSGGSGTVTWTGTGLIGGLTLSSAGVLGGTLGTSVPALMVTATDSVTGQMATMTYSIVAQPPALNFSGGGALTEVATNAAISQGFGASGGTPPYSFSALGLPMGLTLGAQTGILSGAVATPGNYSFTISVSDSGGQTRGATVSLSVLGITTPTATQATAGSAYSFTLGAAGGTGSYSWSGSGLPAGLGLSAAGVLSGTPRTGGTVSFTATVSDGVATAQGTVSITITGSTPLTTPGGSLGGGQANVSYSASLNAVGGSGAYTWTITGGSLPAGLTINSQGAISGTPTTPGSYSFTAQVTDGNGNTVSGSFTIIVAPAPLALISSNTLPNGVMGSAYPLQIFTASGGAQPYTFSISVGALPAGLTFVSGQIGGTPTGTGTSNFTVLVTDGNGATASIPLSILVNTAANLILSDTYLSFTVMTGAAVTPTGDNVTVRSSAVQQILNYSYAVSPAVPWLTVMGGTTTPGSLAVNLTSAALSQAAAPAPYLTSILVTCLAPSPCAGMTQNVSVALRVSAPPPMLSLTSTLLSFNSATANPVAVSMPLGIQNTGSGALTINSITTANPWVTVSGAPASVLAGPAVSATVTVNPAGLPAGYNASSVTVNSSGGSLTVPVELNISANTTISLSPSAGQYGLPQGGALSPVSGSFQVSSNSTQAVAWSAAVQPGAAWLSTSSAGGTSSAANAGAVSYSIDPTQAAQLPAGVSYGTIRVTSDAVTDTPQDYQVSVTVSAGLPAPFLSPAGLLFAPGTATSQPVSVYASSISAAPYQASAATTDGANWLSVSPATGTSSATAPGMSTVSVNTAGLAPGVYAGLASYAFSAAAVRSVNVTLIVTGAGGSIEIGPSPHATGACVPKLLVPTQTGLVTNFLQLAALPTPLSVLLADNCGNLITNGQVTATFSNGDGPLALTPVDAVSGVYSGTWTPVGVSPQVTISTVASAPGLLAGVTRTNGAVAQNPGPLLTQNGVLHVYGPRIGGAVAPGTILQIYGANLAGGPVTSTTVPLTTSLGGTSVTIGGIAAPLYYVSPGQINAQAPFELMPGNQYQVVANVNGALSAPQTIAVAGAVPGIASYQNGQILAQHLDGSLVSELSPAKPGTYVILYLAGLGATDTPVADGAGSPASPLAHPVTVPVLTLNGTTQPYQFVGMTPGIVGLYQMNFLVPAGTANGDMQLVVSQAGVASNSVILPVLQ